MDKNLKFAMIGLVGAISIQQMAIFAQNANINLLHKRLVKSNELNSYLANVIDRNDVPLTEFDKIAIEDILG